MYTKKLLAIIVLCVAWQANIFCDEIEWTGTLNPIPNDGNVYYIDSNLVIDGTTIVDGVLELRNDAILTNSSILSVNGTVNVYGDSKLSNGYLPGESPGAIHINHGGAIILLNGTLHNAFNTSIINVNPGGSFYNYYGIVQADDDTTLNVKAGGKYHNVRGNLPNLANITFFNGCEFFDNNEVNLDRDLQINWVWTLTEKATINGYGNEISFFYSGAIAVAAELYTSLLLEDIIFNNVSGSKIRCEDVTGTLSFNNVIWNQSDDTSFASGTIHVAGNWTIQGPGADFAYQSNQISTIASNATMRLKNTTFHYITTPNTNAFKPTDASSIIHLDNGSIRTSEPWIPTNGTLLTTGIATLNAATPPLDLRNLDNIIVQGSVHRIGDVRLY